MTIRLVVVGDALLDIDLVGTAERLCPDAPVPVLDGLVEYARPGGAALSALLAARDGHEVTLVSPLGDDDDGRRLVELLPGVQVIPVPYAGATPVKQRVRSNGQSLLRLDSGTAIGELGSLPDGVASAVAEADAVLVADYGRGTADSGDVRRLLSEAVTGTPVVWDPHPRGAEPVAGVHLATPNESEARQWSSRYGTPNGRPNRLASTTVAAASLVRSWRARAVAVTLGDRGALLTYGGDSPVVVPAPLVKGGDSCGAGDRFAVTAAVGLGSGLVTTEAVQAAVQSATAYVAAGGAAALSTPPQHGAAPVAQEAGEEMCRRVAGAGGVVVATGGCFDLLHAGHVSMLRAARSLGDCLVVCLNSDESVRRLKGPSRPLVPVRDRAAVLEALDCVDAVVVFEEDTPVEVLRRLRPHIWAKGGDYAGTVVPEAAVVEGWGGQAVILPYVEGRSTTQLVATAAMSVQT